jgi:hypothetical protein
MSGVALQEKIEREAIELIRGGLASPRSSCVTRCSRSSGTAWSTAIDTLMVLSCRVTASLAVRTDASYKADMTSHS